MSVPRALGSGGVPAGVTQTHRRGSPGTFQPAHPETWCSREAHRRLCARPHPTSTRAPRIPAAAPRIPTAPPPHPRGPPPPSFGPRAVRAPARAHTWLSSAASGSGPDTLSTRALAPLWIVRSRSQSQRGGATRVSPFPRRARRPREHTPGRSLNLFVFLTDFFLLLLRPLRYLFCKVPTDNIVSQLLLFTSLEFFSPLSLLCLAVPSLMSPRPRPAAGFPLVGSSVRAAPLLRTRGFHAHVHPEFCRPPAPQPCFLSVMKAFPRVSCNPRKLRATVMMRVHLLPVPPRTSVDSS